MLSDTLKNHEGILLVKCHYLYASLSLLAHYVVMYLDYLHDNF